MKITTTHAAIAAYLANGNPELSELYNRCQFTIDDTAFIATCKRKDWTEVVKQVEEFVIVGGVGTSPKDKALA